jgi:hypothetical protein
MDSFYWTKGPFSQAFLAKKGAKPTKRGAIFAQFYGEKKIIQSTFPFFSFRLGADIFEKKVKNCLKLEMLGTWTKNLSRTLPATGF